MILFKDLPSFVLKMFLHASYPRIGARVDPGKFPSKGLFAIHSCQIRTGGKYFWNAPTVMAKRLKENFRKSSGL